MFHPTPHQWTDDRELTHVFYDNHMPPSSGFGWSSLCDSVQVPIEGEHFELIQEATAEDVTCDKCKTRIDSSHIDLDSKSIASVNGCLARIKTNQDGLITDANRFCRGILHYDLSFEPDSFTGDLNDEVENVCSECWSTYVEHQWRARDEGGQFAVEVWDDSGQLKYFADSAETIKHGQATKLRLTSKDGLKKEFFRDQIEVLRLTPSHDINY